MVVEIIQLRGPEAIADAVWRRASAVCSKEWQVVTFNN
jgi:hypothetical protein